MTDPVDCSVPKSALADKKGRRTIRVQERPVFQTCRRFTIVLALTIPMVVSACQRDRVVVPEALHPTEENIPEITDPRSVLRETGSDAEAAPPVVDFTQQQEVTIGVREGLEHEMIGDVMDIAISGAGLFIAEWDSDKVRIYRRDGSYWGSVGTPGEAPGEFMEVQSIAVAASGQKLYVSDFGGYRVQVFRLEEQAFTFEHSFTMPELFASVDLCVVGEHVYALGIRNCSTA